LVEAVHAWRDGLLGEGRVDDGRDGDGRVDDVPAGTVVGANVATLLPTFVREACHVVGARPPGFLDERTTPLGREIADGLSGQGVPRCVVPDEVLACAHRIGGGLPMAVGIVQESLRPHADRRVAGAVYTPYDVARALVERALPVEIGRTSGLALVDPACGGGAFLVAAADALFERGWTPHDVVAGLWGADVDPESVWATRAALTLWHALACGGPLSVAAEDLAPLVMAQIVEANSLLEGRRVWPTRTTAFDVVVGNPPYLGQLKRATSRSRLHAQAIGARFGEGLAAPYADDALLFVLAGLDLAARGGTVHLLLPESVLASRDGGAVRWTVEQQSVCTGLWWARDRVFDADVEVISIRFRKADSGHGRHATLPPPEVDTTAEVMRWVGREFSDGPGVPVRSPSMQSTTVGTTNWSWLLTGLHGVPGLPPSLREPPVRKTRAKRSATPLARPPATAPGDDGDDGDALPRIADIASGTAGFRDEYYGLAPFVREGPPPLPLPLPGEQPAASKHRGASGHVGLPRADGPIDPIDPMSPGDRRPVRLVTVGLIDPAHLRWGLEPTRFNRQRWEHPTVDLDAMQHTHSDSVSGSDSDAAARLARWGAERLVPKVLVATQTRIIEAVVDPVGTLWPSTPVVAVVPTNPNTSLWMLAAAVSSPHATAWALTHFRGSALVGDAVKLAAWQLEAIPLPIDRTAWEAGAAHFEQATEAALAGDGAVWRAALFSFATVMASAYGDGPRADLVAWWADRLPPWRTGSLVASS